MIQANIDNKPRQVVFSKAILTHHHLSEQGHEAYF